MKRIVSLLLVLLLVWTTMQALGEEELQAEYDAADALCNEGKYEEALPLMQAVAEKGYTRAMRALGYDYAMGYYTGGVPDIEMALSWYTKAADLGDTDAMYGIGWLYDEGKVTDGVPERVQALIWWEKAAAGGNWAAMYALGRHYAHNADPRDFDLSRKWLTDAFNAGYEVAGNSLGNHYASGDFSGGTPDYAQALAWYQKAATAGHANSVGVVIDYLQKGVVAGDGTVVLEPDHAGLLEFLRAQWAQGSTNTSVYDWLGWLLAGNSEAVEAEYPLAFEAYMAGANLGSGYCMAQLGMLYRDGRLGVTDPVAAAAWFTKALDAGYDQAREMLDGLNAQ